MESGSGPPNGARQPKQKQNGQTNFHPLHSLPPSINFPKRERRKPKLAPFFPSLISHYQISPIYPAKFQTFLFPPKSAIYKISSPKTVLTSFSQSDFPTHPRICHPEERAVPLPKDLTMAGARR